MKRIFQPHGLPGTGLVLLLALLSLLLASLTTTHKEDFKLPVIINRGDQTSSCLTPLYMMNAWYHLERLEKISDTLDLAIKPDRKKMSENYFEFYEDPTKGNASAYSDEGLILVVDTVQELTMLKKPIWASYLFHRSFNRSLVLQDDTLQQFVKSYPIYIVNVSTNKTAILETQDGSAMMITEAKDHHGKWQPIEYWSNSWCGNSYFSMSIAPRHFTFTRGIKCSGDTKRLCRLKLTDGKTTIYSNEFFMNITESQFAKPNGTE